MAGIQKSDNGQKFVGKIKPQDDKFFVTINEVSDESKRSFCGDEYGLLKPRLNKEDKYKRGEFDQYFGNTCLSNFEWTFSKDVRIVCSQSKDTFGCVDVAFAKFGLFADKTFVMLSSRMGNSYVAHGQCEKVN